jgi:hypothetical protein
MTIAIARFLAGFAASYVCSSLLESYFHQHVNDAPRRVVERWLRWPRLFKQLIETNFSHHTIHHVRTYRRDHVTQFSSAEEKAELDSELTRTPHGRAVMKARYGATFSPMGWLAFCAPLVPISIIAALAFGPAAAFGALLASAIPPFMSNTMHPYLHLSYEEARRRAPWLISLFLSTWYMRAVTRHHFLHHRYCNMNFNLTLGGDWLRCKVRRASPRDIAEMRRLGIRLD